MPQLRFSEAPTLARIPRLRDEGHFVDGQAFSSLPQPSRWLEELLGDKEPSSWGLGLAWDGGKGRPTELSPAQ